MSQKQLLCDFRAKIDFFDCLGVKLLEQYGVQFFQVLDPILGAIYEDHALLCLFGTVNINKAIIHDKKVIFALNFTIQVSFKGFIMLLKELKLIIDEVCLINI